MTLALRQLSTAQPEFEAEFARLRHWSAETDQASVRQRYLGAPA